MHLYSTEYELLIGMQHHIIIMLIPNYHILHARTENYYSTLIVSYWSKCHALPLYTVKLTEAMAILIYITQDVVRAILWVLPGCSCTVSFAIAIMSSEQCLHICNTIATHPVLTSSDHNHSNYSSSLATIILWRHTVWLCSWQRFCMLVYVA